MVVPSGRQRKIHQVVAGGGIAVNKDVEEIFENIRDVVAVHQDDVAAMDKLVKYLHSELQSVSLGIRTLEEASRKAEAAGQRISQQLTEEPRITQDRAKMWVGLSLLAALLFFAAGGYAGWRYAQDGVTKEIAQLPELTRWAASKEGKTVYQFAAQGDLQRLMRCQGDGWKVKHGVCYPFSNDKNEVTGWRMP